MKIKRKRSNLALGKNCRKRVRCNRYKAPCPNPSREGLGVLVTCPTFKSPAVTKRRVGSTSTKRMGSRSPYIHGSPYKCTPSKARSAKKMRKCLFSNKSPAKSTIETIPEDVISEAFEELKKEGLDRHFIDFFKLVQEDKFPLDNIALALFADVVRWHSCESTTGMRYSRENKIFWKLGYRLFGGRFLHFMGGTKSEGQVVLNTSDRGFYDPQSSKINFAVPSVTQLAQFDPYDLKSAMKTNSTRPFAPGVLVDMIATLGEKVNGISCCLTFDGKKIKQGLTPTSGDVDLFGLEKGASLHEKKQKLATLVQPLLDLQDRFCHTPGSDGISELSDEDKGDLKLNLRSALRSLSDDILEIQEIRKKKEYAKERLMERCGDENWRNSTFAMAISATIAYMHDIDIYLGTIRDVLNEILCCISSLNGEENEFVEEEQTNVYRCMTYKGISEPGQPEPELCHTREIKQRTDRWYERRKLAKVTGSTMYSAIGLDGLKKQRSHFDEVVCGNTKEPVSDKVSEFMKYGTDNEINAVATLVGKVMPAFFPAKLCCEEGFIEIDQNEDGVPFMVVSPDGSIRGGTDMATTEIALEIKCPVREIHKTLPPRYVLQCQAEIEALAVDLLVYVCWRPDYSSVFLVKKDPNLYSKAYETAKSLYKDSAKRVKKVPAEVKELKDLVQKSSQDQETVQFLGLFPSLTHDSSKEIQCHSTSFKLNRLQLLLSQIVKAMEDKYELTREKATEAVVFICSTLDRHLASKSVTAPVCWFTKGNSLDVATARKILEHVLNECFKCGIHTPAISFDGQWHAIATRDVNNQPLTKLQLQKDVWRETEKMSKQSILNELKNKNKHPKWEKENEVIIACSESEETLPKFSERVYVQRQKEARKQQRVANNSTPDLTPPTADPKDTEGSTVVSEDDVSTATETKEAFVFDVDKATVVLSMLQTDPNCNKKHIWDQKTPDDIIACFLTPGSIRKLRDVDLKVVVRYLKRNGHKQLKESDKKSVKLVHIFDMLCLKEDTTQAKKVTPATKKVRLETPRSLKSLAYSEVTKMRKGDLNIIYAEYLWPKKLQDWQDNALMYKTRLYLEPSLTDQEEHENNSETDFFYIPAFSSERDQYEVSCIDSSHLLTRTRRKCCKGGLDGCQNSAWRHVAKSGKTNLSTAMVECILDQMSVSTALSHFSENVEKEMKLNGYTREAELCRDIRMWWKAEDDPGICARERVTMRLALRKRLMGYAAFEHFPPPGMFVRGWPVQLWEALLASIDAKTLLYSLSKQKTYNNRAFSSLVGETFFSEVTLFDRRGQGTVSSAEFEEFMGTAVEKLHMRLDDRRNFVYRTSHRTVYNLIGGDNIHNQDEDEEALDDDIVVVDHAFDKMARARVRGRKKEETVDNKRNALQRGSLGVRWDRGRRNESKLLPTVRMGIDDCD